MRPSLLLLLLLPLATAGCPKSPDSKVPTPPGKVPAADERPEPAAQIPWPLQELTIPPGAKALGGMEQAGRPYGGDGSIWERRFSDSSGFGKVAAHVEAALAGSGFSRLDSEFTEIEPLATDSGGKALAVQKGLRTYAGKDAMTVVKLEYRYMEAGDDGKPEHLYRYEVLKLKDPMPLQGIRLVPLK